MFADTVLSDSTGIDISHIDLLRHLQDAHGCAAQRLLECPSLLTLDAMTLQLAQPIL